MHVRFILVEPHEAGNVGAAARVIKNFGFSDLWIVGTRPQRMDDISEWWAKGATDLLHAAHRAETLEEALADAHLSIATTAVRGRHVFDPLTPPEVARLAEETLGDGQRLALVFGREESGLSGREVALCQRTASIPTSPDYATLNLAMSVGIFCFELGKGLRSRAADPDPAPGELLQNLTNRTRHLLDEIGFFGQKSPERMCAELQALAGRARLRTREASMLLSFVAHVEKAIRKGSAAE